MESDKQLNIFGTELRKFTIRKRGAMTKTTNEMISALAKFAHIQEFEDELVYGKKFRILGDNNKPYDAVCYLLEQYPGLLVAMRNNGEHSVLDIKNIQMKKEDVRTEAVLTFLIENPVKYIILRQKFEKLIFLFDKQQERDAFMENLKSYKSKLNMMDPHDDEFSQANKLFEMGKIKDELPLSKFHQILNKLNMRDHAKNNYLMREIKKWCKTESTSDIKHEEFMMFMRVSYCTEELYDIWNEFCDSKIQYDPQRPTIEVLNEKMTISEYSRYLRNQKESQKTIEMYCNTMFADEYSRISLYTFGRGIYANDNSIYSMDLRIPHHDIKQPLNHYFCFSSHNTYLTGNQLTSDSKVERYIEDLDRGLRCVELDVHDDGDIPIIKHGYTATKKINFEDVIKAISRYSTANRRHTPIILSIENHCNDKNREKMAAILLEEFQNRLYIIQKKDTQYATLEELIGKVIIKTDSKKEATKLMELEEDQKQEQVYSPLIPPNPQNPQSPVRKPKAQQIPEEKRVKDKKKEFEQKLAKTKKQIRHKKRLINNYLQVLKDINLAKLTGLFKGQISLNSKFCESVSLSFGKAMQKYNNQKQAIINYTSRSWLRVYPEGTNFKSGNYNPIRNHKYLNTIY